MPNYCNNCLSIEGDRNTVKRLLAFVQSDENAFDFEKIIPMPDNIYRGGVGAKEKEIYGENNWYDWSIKNWGTKWNSVDVEVDDNAISFLTAWSPCDPVIKALAEMFPAVRITYEFYETGMCFCGQRIYENGELIFYYDGDYAENPLCFDDDEEADQYTLSDTMFPVKMTGSNEAIEDLEVVKDGIVKGKLFYREYEDGKIYRMADGWFIGKEDYIKRITEALTAGSLAA